MKLAKENLGKVSVTVEKAYHSVNKEYDKLVVVEEEGQFRTFISRKPVPIGIELTDREFWLPFSSVKESIIIDYNKFKQYIRTGEGLLDDSIVTRHIKSRNVTGDKIAESTITFINIANEAVTLSKINKEAIDSTLTKEGYLAEAKHTGERLSNVEGLTVDIDVTKNIIINDVGIAYEKQISDFTSNTNWTNTSYRTTLKKGNSYTISIKGTLIVDGKFQVVYGKDMINPDGAIITQQGFNEESVIFNPIEDYYIWLRSEGTVNDGYVLLTIKCNNDNTIINKISKLNKCINTYNTPQDMISDNTLKVGDNCYVMGKQNMGDGGQSYYRILHLGQETINNVNILALNNGLAAVLAVNDNTFNIAHLGYNFYPNPDDFGAFYNRIEPFLKDNSTLIATKPIYIHTPAYITKRIHLLLDDIVVTNQYVHHFVYGNSTHTVKYANMQFKKMYSYDNRDNPQNCYDGGIVLKAAMFCNFKFDVISKIGVPILFDPENTCFQNIFYFNIIEDGGEGIIFSQGTATGKEDSHFAEGNRFEFTFIRKFNRGISLYPNITCGANYFSGAIDCVEVENSWDIWDDSLGRKDANTGSVWLLNFVRHSRWSNKHPSDTIIEPSFGLKTAADIQSGGNISYRTGFLGNGTINVYDPIASVPRLDFYKDGISVETGGTRIGRVGVLPNGIGILEGDKGVKLQESGIVNIESNTNSISITFNIQKNDNNYNVFLTPSWLTKLAITNKTTNGFTINFETTTKQETIGYQVLFI